MKTLVIALILISTSAYAQETGTPVISQQEQSDVQQAVGGAVDPGTAEAIYSGNTYSDNNGGH